MYIYLPLEHIESRYTTHLDRDIINYLATNNIPFIRIDPEMPKRHIVSGSFLDAPTTIEYKSRQLAAVANLYHKGFVNNSDIIFCSDIWFPGIESIAYLNYFTGIDVKLTGFLHAGSFTDTDFVRDMERWAKGFEDVVFDIATEIFVASNFIKNDVIKKRMINPKKITVTGLPLDRKINDMKYIPFKEREDIVVFNGRNVDEKQPWLFDMMSKRYPEYKFVNTQRAKLNKADYYELLRKAKVVVSFALQENFGYGVNEAVALGCIPVLPNRLVYPEHYSDKYLYDDFDEACEMVVDAILGESVLPHTEFHSSNPFKTWFK